MEWDEADEKEVTAIQLYFIPKQEIDNRKLTF